MGCACCKNCTCCDPNAHRYKPRKTTTEALAGVVEHGDDYFLTPEEFQSVLLDMTLVNPPRDSGDIEIVEELKKIVDSINIEEWTKQFYAIFDVEAIRKKDYNRREEETEPEIQNKVETKSEVDKLQYSFQSIFQNPQYLYKITKACLKENIFFEKHTKTLSQMAKDHKFGDFTEDENKDEEKVDTDFKIDGHERRPTSPTLKIEKNRTFHGRIKSAIGAIPTIKLPRDLDELRDIMSEAGAEYAPLKAIGVGYAFNDVGFTSQNGWLIDMTEIRKPNLIEQLKIEKNNNLLNKKGIKLLRESELIISESGATIELIHNYTWPKHQKVDGRRFSVWKDPKNKKEHGKYKMLQNIPGFDQLTIGGLVNVGAQGFGNKIPCVQNNVLSYRLLTFECVLNDENGNVENKLVEYQIEPSNDNGAIHNPKEWKKYYGDKIILIQDDDIFQSALVGAGAFGIVYSYHLKLIDAFMVTQQKILTSWQTVKTNYPILKKAWKDNILYRMEWFVSAYKGCCRINDSEPVLLIIETKIEETGDPNEPDITPLQDLTYRLAGGVYASPCLSTTTGAAITLMSHVAPGLLGLFHELALTELLHHEEGIILDAPAAFSLGAPAFIPSQVGSVCVRESSVIDAIDKWISIFNTYDEDNNVVMVDDAIVSTSPLGVTFCEKGANGYVSMADQYHDTCWLECPFPDYSNWGTYGSSLLPETKGWMKGKEAMFEKLTPAPHYGKFHLAMPYTDTWNADVWNNKEMYPHFKEFHKAYKKFNQSRLFSNQFTHKTELDKICFEC